MKPLSRESLEVADGAAPADIPAERARGEARSTAMDDGGALAQPMPRQLGGRLAGMSLPRQIYILSIWPLLEQVLNFLVGTVDLILASNLQPENIGLAASDALSVAGYVGWLMGLLQGAVGIGSAALVARAVGGQHKRLANAAMGQAVLLALVAGSLMGLFIFTLARPIGQIAGVPGEGLELCVIYLRLIAVAGPFMAVLFVGTACLRAAGDTRTPFFVMVVVNLINVGSSVLMVYGPAPIGEAGAAGVPGIAAGTLLAWGLGAILVLLMMLHPNAVVRFRLFRLRPHWHTAKRIIRVAMPQLAESIGVWGGNYLVLIIIGYIAAQGMMGAHMIAIRIESISFLAGFAFATAAATLTGQYLGANNPAMARRAILLCTLWGVIVMGAAGALFVAIPRTLTSIVSSQALHLEAVPPLLFLCGWVQPFFAVSIVLSSALRGAGDTKWSAILSYLSLFLVRLPLVFLFAIVLDYGLLGVWYGLCIEWVVRAVLFVARFLHGGWQNLKV